MPLPVRLMLPAHSQIFKLSVPFLLFSGPSLPLYVVHATLMIMSALALAVDRMRFHCTLVMKSSCCYESAANMAISNFSMPVYQYYGLGHASSILASSLAAHDQGQNIRLDSSNLATALS